MALEEKVLSDSHGSLNCHALCMHYSFFSGDALAAPTHWYYGGLPQIKADYGPSGITDYTKPKKELRGSIMNKSDVNGGGRSSGGFSGMFKKRQTVDIDIIGGVINHGKKEYWSPNKSIHYHATLQRGENTLEAQLARSLMKTIVKNKGKFRADDWRVEYVRYVKILKCMLLVQFNSNSRGLSNMNYKIFSLSLAAQIHDSTWEP